MNTDIRYALTQLRAIDLNYLAHGCGQRSTADRVQRAIDALERAAAENILVASRKLESEL